MLDLTKTLFYQAWVAWDKQPGSEYTAKAWADEMLRASEVSGIPYLLFCQTLARLGREGVGRETIMKILAIKAPLLNDSRPTYYACKSRKHIMRNPAFPKCECAPRLGRHADTPVKEKVAKKKTQSRVGDAETVRPTRSRHAGTPPQPTGRVKDISVNPEFL